MDGWGRPPKRCLRFNCLAGPKEGVQKLQVELWACPKLRRCSKAARGGLPQIVACLFVRCIVIGLNSEINLSNIIFDLVSMTQDINAPPM